MLPQHNKLLGWGLIAFGVWALYDITHRGLDDHRCWSISSATVMRTISSHGIPNILVGILLMVAGIKLLGLHPAKKADPNEADTLPPYPNEKQ